MDMTDNRPTGPIQDSFVVTHCRRCAAGWSRTGAAGGVLTVCLLDREPVMAGMTDCDRFEPKDERQA